MFTLKITEFRNLLLTFYPEIEIFHNEAAKRTKGNYIVFSEVARKSFRANNRTAEKALRVAVDYFTPNEYDVFHERITELFEINNIAYSDPTILYERDTKLTHYAYTVEI